jgi:hypothetical protein
MLFIDADIEQICYVVSPSADIRIVHSISCMFSIDPAAARPRTYSVGPSVRN